LDFSKGTKPCFLYPNSVFFLNARSAILAVISSLRPTTVWMPSYLCATMLDATNISKIPVRFFPVDDHLQIKEGAWISEVITGDVVIIIDYFGFRASEWVYEAIRERGAWILEDACQALLSSHVGQYSDFVVYSPRKFVGVPDGGILWSKNPFPIGPEKIKPPSSWWLKAFGACLLRRDFDNSQSDGDRKWFQLFKEMESEMPVGNYEASPLSIAILETAITWDLVSSKRRENYQILLDNLRDYALYKDLPDDVVPLGFPITVRNRNELRQALFDENIYPPIHWELSDTVPEQFAESYQLSQHILTLICDQRYCREDMERMIQFVRATASFVLT